MLPYSAPDWIATWGNEKTRKAELVKAKKAVTAIQKVGFPGVLARPIPAQINGTLPYTNAFADSAAKAFYAAQEHANSAATDYLRELDLALTAVRSKGRGERNSADQNGILRRVAHCYRESLGELPTHTPGAPFSNVVVLLLKYWSPTDKMPRDVTRQVKAALKSS